MNSHPLEWLVIFENLRDRIYTLTGKEFKKDVMKIALDISVHCKESDMKELIRLLETKATKVTKRTPKK